MRLIADAGPDLRVRPEPHVWSAIEYAAHSRDITALHRFGVEQALTGGEPVYPAIVADDLIQTAAANYVEEDPRIVVDTLDDEAGRLADLAVAAPTDRWELGITIGEERSTVRRLLEHALHDSLHHLGDVQRGYRTFGHDQGGSDVRPYRGTARCRTVCAWPMQRCGSTRSAAGRYWRVAHSAGLLSANSPTMSRTLSMNCGSGDSLKSSTRCGLSPNARQIRLIDDCDMPVALAIE